MISITNAFAPYIDGGGLSLGVYGGTVLLGTTPTAIAGQSVLLTAEAVNYVQLNLTTGAVSANTSGFSPLFYPIAKATTSNSGITTLIDSRSDVGASAVQTPASQTAEVTHVLTAGDIAQGFISVPVVWPTPWGDTNFIQGFSIQDLDPPINLSFAVGDQHNVTASGFDAVVYIAAAQPLVQGQLDAFNVNTPQSVVLVAPLPTLYSIQLYISGYGDGLHTDLLNVDIEWTDATGKGAQTALIAQMAGDRTTFAGNGILFGTFPLFGIAGSNVGVVSSFTANPFHYDMSVRIIQNPSNATIAQPGDQFTVQAFSIHR